MKNKIISVLLFLFCSSLQIIAQSQSFKVTERALPATIYPHSSSIVQKSIPLIKIQKDLDIINLTNSNQDIVVRKQELILNTISQSDKAKASYCYAIFCRDPETFADTVTFLPQQSVPLSFDFTEASYPARSIILYNIINLNTGEISNIYMDYQGVVSIEENINEKMFFKIFPNPSNGQIYISTETKNDLSKARIFVKDCLGKNILEKELDLNANNLMLLDLQSLNKGIYFVQIENQSQQVFHQLISIE